MSESIFKSHKIVDLYELRNRNGSVESGWKLAYSHPIMGTFKRQVWVEHTETYALIERPMGDGIEIREVPERFLTRVI